jgi:hypothetical protein
MATFDCIPGLPLLSSNGELVGSLHPDDLSACTPGSNIECLILSRAQLPTLGSALRKNYERGDGAVDEAIPWDLLWVLHVAWKDGIAERRGVGQILVSAIESSCSPGPEIKQVLLG